MKGGYTIIKKLLACILVVSCFASGIKAIPVMAENEAQEDNAIQDEIDALFDELDFLALQEHLSASTDFSAKEKSQDIQRSFIDARLEELGVHKIDPDNPDDLAYLAELPASNAPTMPTSGVYDSAPDLSAFAQIYSIYVSDGTVNPYYNGSGDPGASYAYRRIRVIDDKGHNQLYSRQKATLFENNSCTGSAFVQLLEYNFKFIISEFIGVIPKGILLNWAIGMFDTITNLSSGNITSGDANYYEIQFDTVTSMIYYYMYYQGWKLIGVEAEANFARRDLFRGNVNGMPVNNFIYEENNRVYSQNILVQQYAINYLTAMNRDLYFCTVNPLGTLKIKGYDNETYSFTPVFVRIPSHLL